MQRLAEVYGLLGWKRSFMNWVASCVGWS